MPWTASNTINSMKKKSLELRELFAEVANAVLAESGSEENAIQAGLAAVAKKEGKVRVKKAVEAKPAPSIPPHLAAILALKAKRQQTEEQEVSKAVRATTAALETTSEEINTSLLFKQRNRLEADPDRSLVAVEWDKEGRLVLKFDDGQKLVSDPVPVNTVSTSTVLVGGSGGGSGTGSAFDFTDIVSQQEADADVVFYPDPGNGSLVTNPDNPSDWYRLNSSKYIIAIKSWVDEQIAIANADAIDVANDYTDTQISTVNTTVSALSEEVVTNTDSITSLQSELQTLNNAVDVVEADITDLVDDLLNVTNLVSSLDTRQDSIETVVTSIDNSLVVVNNELASLDARVDVLEAQQSGISVEINALVSANQAQGEPTGFPALTSTISFAGISGYDADYQFDATGTTFELSTNSQDIWVRGQQFVKTSNQNLTVSENGLSYIAVNIAGNLVKQQTYFDFEYQAPVAYVYRNAGNLVYFAEERHGTVLDWQTHEYLHRTRGAAYSTGFAITDFVTTGNGATDSDCSIGLTPGTFFDEDIKIHIQHGLGGRFIQPLLNVAKIPVFHRNSTGWTGNRATNIPLLHAQAGRAYYDNDGVLTEVQNNHYCVMFIIATNNLLAPVMAIMGQGSYGEKTAAETVQFESLSLSGLPLFEFRPLYKLVYEVRDAYNNTAKAALRTVIDLRKTQNSDFGTPAIPAQVHANLAGLDADDHPQYFNQTRGDLRYAQLSELGLTNARVSALESASQNTGVPLIATETFVVSQNTQVLFSEEISTEIDSWIEVEYGAILSEVN